MINYRTYTKLLGTAHNWNNDEFKRRGEKAIKKGKDDFLG